MNNTVYAWKIDTEYLHEDYEDEQKVTGTEPYDVWGPSAATDELLARVDTDGQPFKLYDDDGLKCLSGKIVVMENGVLPEAPELYVVVKPWDADEQAAFGPLNDYGEGGYGCTEIRYPSGPNRKWETL